MAIGPNSLVEKRPYVEFCWDLRSHYRHQESRSWPCHAQLKLVNKFGNLNSIKDKICFLTDILIFAQVGNNNPELDKGKFCTVLNSA